MVINRATLFMMEILDTTRIIMVPIQGTEKEKVKIQGKEKVELNVTEMVTHIIII